MIKKMDEHIFLKQVTALLLILVTGISLIGCGKDKNSLFHICGQDLSYEETLVFGYIYGMTYNLKASDSFDTIYEGEQNYGTYCKGQIQQDIVDTMLLYHESKEKNLTLSSDEKKKVSDDVSKLIAYYGEAVFEAAGIKEKDIEAVCKMKALANQYVASYLEAEENNEETQRYVKVYQVTFLTAKLDGNGNYSLDDEGNVVMMDNTFISNQKQEAEMFATRVREGEDIKALVKEYDTSVNGVEKYLKYDDLSGEYKKIIDGLSVGETSQSFSFDYGYYVVKLLAADGDEYADAVADHDKATKNDKKRNEELQRLKEKYIGTSDDYKEKEWDDIRIETFVK